MVQLDSGGGGDDTEQAATERRRAQEVEGEQQAQDALRQLDDSNLESTPTTDPTTTATEPVRQTGTVDSGPQLDGGQQAAEEQETTQQTQEPPETVQDGPTPTTGTPGQTGVVEPEAPAPDRPPADMPQEPDIATEDVSQAQRSRAASQFEEQIQEQTGEEFDVTAEDVVVRGGQFTLGGSARAALSRQQAEAAGVDLSARAERAEAQAALAPESEAAIESGGLDIGTETLKEFEEEAFSEAQQGTGGISVKAVEARGEQRAQIEEQLEQQIEEQTGREVELEAGDFEITTEDGERQAQLTQQGIDKVQTQPVTEFVEEKGIRPKKFVIEPGPFEGAFPGAGVIGAGVRLEELGPVAKDIGVARDFGNIDLQVAQFGERPVTPGPGTAPRPVIGTKDFETVLAELSTDVTEAIQVGEPGAFAGQFGPTAAAAVKRQRTQGFTPAERERQKVASAFVESSIESPALFAIGAAQLGKNIADFSVKFGETEIQELDTLIGSAAQAGVNLGAVGAAKAIEAPALTAGRLGGTLVGSGAVFAGAAAIGPRTSLGARALIQPGEEALGFGGFAATRRIAGRPAAQRLFPNKEPLIFSEESFIRGVRAAGAKARGVAARADIESRLPDVELKQTTIETIEAARLEAFRIRNPRPFMETGPIEISQAELEQEGVVVIQDFGEVDADVDPEGQVDAVDGETDPDGMQVGGGGFDLEFEQETGTGQAEVLRMRVEDPTTELDMPSETEFERARGDPTFEARMRAETALDVDPIGDVGIGAVEARGVAERTAPTEQLDPMEGLAEALVPQMELDLELESPAVEQEFEPVELEVNIPIQIQKVEARQEMELELRAEGRRELETNIGGRQQQPLDRRPLADRIAEVKTEVFEFDIPEPDDISRRLERAGGVDMDLEGLDVDIDDINMDFDFDD